MALHARFRGGVAIVASVAVVVAAVASGNVYAADAMIEQAQLLLREGKSQDAYALLEKLEFERAGDVEFDTALGIAALDAGKPDKATLAFERVLAVNPNLVGARLDMARAYFALGDFARARLELGIVSAQEPPAAARLVIANYQKAIDERERAKRTVVTGYAESVAGYDNNITSVVGDFTNAVLATYNLPGFQPTGNAVKRGSAIIGVAGGVDVTHHVSDALALSVGVDARRRQVLSANSYTSDQVDLRGGASYTMGANTVRGGVTVQAYRQPTDVPTANRNAYGVNAEWRHSFSEQDHASLLGVATRQRFPDISSNDVDSLTFGGSWLHFFNGTYKPLFYLSVLRGQDNAQNLLANGADNSKRSISGRLYGQLSFGENLDVFGSLGLLYRADRSMNARSTLVEYGNDHTSDITLGLNWRPMTNWTVRPQIMYSENRSNVALSEYKRTEGTITVRYDFR